MLRVTAIRAQTALIIALFVGSLAVLLIPRREPDVSSHLREASQRLSEAVGHTVDSLPENGTPPDSVVDRLRTTAERVSPPLDFSRRRLNEYSLQTGRQLNPL